MGVVIESQASSVCGAIRYEKRLRAARSITAVLYYSAMFLMLICVVALVKVIVVDGMRVEWVVTADGGKLSLWVVTAAMFAQLSVGLGAYCVAASRFREIAQAAGGGVVFTPKAGKNLRVAGAAFIILTLAELLFSVFYLICAGQPVSIGGVGFGFAGFPDGWMGLAAGGAGQSHVAMIDAAPLVFACLLWVLSCIFDHGAQLQLEKDATI